MSSVDYKIAYETTKEIENLYYSRAKRQEKEIESLKNTINELKLCNSDYYNMVNTCTSKLSRIRNRVSYEETNAENLSEDILAIINEKEICLKPIENHTKEALEFIERYLSLNLDDFNASSLLKKLREILTRGDDYPKEE